MHSFAYILVILAGVLVSAVLGQRLSRVSTPLVQIALGVAIYFLPFIEIELNLDPEIFLVMFIAPLLFDDAKKADKPALLKLINPILSLSIGLVLATCLAVGFAFNYIMPSVPLAVAFALAAALAPTDAVSVSTLEESSSIGTSRRLLLQGESLLNDAASIVSFQFAVGFLTTASFVVWQAGIGLLISFIGGILVGAIFMLLRGFLVRWLRSIGFESITFHVLLEIMTPFLVFIIAESIQIAGIEPSGIIAAVVAGVLYSYTNRTTTPEKVKTTMVSGSVWTVLSFCLNGLVFLILGTELPRIIGEVGRDYSTGLNIALYIVALLAAIYTIRFVWILWLRRRRNLATITAGKIEQNIQNAQNDLDGNSELNPQELSTIQKLEQEAGYSENEAIKTVIAERNYEYGKSEFRIDASRGKFSRKEIRRMRRKTKEHIRAQVRKSFLAERQHPRYWKEHLYDAFLLTICGVKGAITLALLLTLPLTLGDGSPLEHRDLLLLVASGAIIISLLIANFVIPIIAPKRNSDITTEEEVQATIDIFRKVRHRVLDSMDSKNRVASELVARSYDERMQHIKSINNLTDDKEIEIRLLIISYERDYCLKKVAAGEVSRMASSIFLLQLSRINEHMSRQKRLSWTLSALLRQNYLHMKNAAKWISELGSINTTEKQQDLYNEVRALQKETYRFALTKLDTLMDEKPGSIKAINTVKAEFNRRIERLENTHRNPLRSSSVPGPMRPIAETAMPLHDMVIPQTHDHDTNITEIEREAIQYERELIAEALENGKISHATAKNLRDEASLMELDIEDHLE